MALEYTLTKKQYGNLEGLAYWIADQKYIRERYGDNEPEIKRCHDTICGLFYSLDELKVPFWVQNTVICFAEDWRKYKTEYLDHFLKSKNIFVE